MSGKSGEVYPISKLYRIMLKIHKLGLTEYEQTALSISDKIYGSAGACPVARDCDSWMRSLNADGRYFTCGPLNDDLDTRSEIDFESEVVKGEKFHTPLQKVAELQFLKEECISCKMFETCNGCRKHTKDLKAKNLVEDHCQTMKSIMDDIIEMSESQEILNLKTEIQPFLKESLYD
jgi:radical SAM protein with 4Fe4S-binding SPASM domain